MVLVLYLFYLKLVQLFDVFLPFVLPRSKECILSMPIFSPFMNRVVLEPVTVFSVDAFIVTQILRHNVGALNSNGLCR